MRTLTFKPQKKRPQLFWSDRLSRLDIIRDVRLTFDHAGTPIHVVCWFYTDQQDKQKHLTSLSLDHGAQLTNPNPGYLVETKLGFICSNCGSNEHLKYRTDLLPMSEKEDARFNRADYGMYCQCCGTISK